MKSCLLIVCLLIPVWLFAQTDTLAADRALKKAHQFIELQEFDSARVYVHQALQLATPGTRYHRLRLADSLHIAAEFLFRDDELDQALQASQQALSIRQQVYAQPDSVIADSYHQLGMIYRRMGAHQQALDHYKKSIAIKKQCLPPDSRRFADTYNNLMNLLRSMGEFDEALYYGKEAIRINTLHFGEMHAEVAKNMNNLAITYRQKGDYNRALNFFQRSLTIKLAIMDSIHPEIAVGYYGMGSLALAKGDYERALEYAQKAQHIWKELKDPRVPFSNVILGVIYGEKGDYERAISYNQIALDDQVKRLGRKHPMVAGILTNLTNYALLLGKTQDALAYNQEALAIQLELLGTQHPNVAESYESRGKIMLELKRPDEAVADFTKALHIMERVVGPDNPEAAYSRIALGKCYAALQQNELALQHIQAGIAAFEAADLQSHPTLIGAYHNLAAIYLRNGQTQQAEKYLSRSLHALGMPELARAGKQLPALSAVFHKPLLLTTLKLMARVQLADKQAGRASLDAALSYYRLSVALIDSIRLGYKGRDSRLWLAERAHAIYAEGIQVADELYRHYGDSSSLETIFTLMEKSKGMWLAEALQEARARHFAGLPDVLPQLEQQLKVDLAYVEEQLYLATQEKQQEQAAEWRKERFRLKYKQDSLMAVIQTHYPKYYQLKYAFQPPATATVRQHLDDDQLLIDYFLAGDTLYTFSLSKYSKAVHRQLLPRDYAVRIQRFRRSITDTEWVRSAPQQADSTFLAEAFQWYKWLLAAPLATVSDEISRLVILPAGELGYLPFEVLLRQQAAAPADYRSLPYLLNDYSLSRLHTTLLLPGLGHGRTQQAGGLLGRPKTLAGFAPIYKASPLADNSLENLAEATLVRSGELPLPGAKEEVEQVSKLMRGDAFIGKQASKAHFLQLAPQYQMLHLAMHGLIDNENPLFSTLVFSPDSSDYLLKAAELYNMKLQAELVVLSACNSGVGQLRKGEGIMSLSHAFAYSGASSLLMSLWPVADATTGELMYSFYRELKNKQPKDEALRQAKLHYLKTADPLYAHPYFWAAFVASGDMQPLPAESSAPWLWGSLLLLLLAGGWLAIKKLRSVS